MSLLTMWHLFTFPRLRIKVVEAAAILCALSAAGCYVPPSSTLYEAGYASPNSSIGVETPDERDQRNIFGIATVLAARRVASQTSADNESSLHGWLAQRLSADIRQNLPELSEPQCARLATALASLTGTDIPSRETQRVAYAAFWLKRNCPELAQMPAVSNYVKHYLLRIRHLPEIRSGLRGIFDSPVREVKPVGGGELPVVN